MGPDALSKKQYGLKSYRQRIGCQFSKINQRFYRLEGHCKPKTRGLSTVVNCLEKTGRFYSSMLG